MTDSARAGGPAEATTAAPAAPGAQRRSRDGSAADEEFIRALYAEHGAALYAYALQLTNFDRQRAEDLVQDTIVRAWRHPDAIDGRPPRPWLFTVARNLAIDRFRARQARPPEVGQEPLAFAATGDAADQVVLKLTMTEALASLRPDHRAVITVIYFRGHTTTEAAEILGIPVGTVKSRTYYALKALKLALEERGITPGDGAPKAPTGHRDTRPRAVPGEPG